MPCACRRPFSPALHRSGQPASPCHPAPGRRTRRLPSRKRGHSPTATSGPARSWRLPTSRAGPGRPHIPEITCPGAALLGATEAGPCESQHMSIWSRGRWCPLPPWRGRADSGSAPRAAEGRRDRGPRRGPGQEGGAAGRERQGGTAEREGTRRGTETQRQAWEGREDAGGEDGACRLPPPPPEGSGSDPGNKMEQPGAREVGGMGRRRGGPRRGGTT